MNERIFLSPPDMSHLEREMLIDAFDSNWIAPVGPDLAAFEDEVKAFVGVEHAVALTSGTAALHLALLELGVGPGDEVVVPSFTFTATANAVAYCGADLRFIDSDTKTWNVDPELLSEYLEQAAKDGALPKALVTVDLYGQCADYSRLADTCAQHGVHIIEDAAEALGATWDGASAGTFGAAAAISFNGNKIMTTSGGGMLVSNDGELIDRARHLATQARMPAPHYEHEEIGFNYRLSNLLAALGRAQLQRLPSMIDRRRAIRSLYEDALADKPGVAFNPVAEQSEPNHWLTVITVDPAGAGTDREQLRLALEAENIESRPAWKPMHLQPVHAAAPTIGGAVSTKIFERGLCLPSGSALTADDIGRVVSVLNDHLD